MGFIFALREARSTPYGGLPPLAILSGNYPLDTGIEGLLAFQGIQPIEGVLHTFLVVGAVGPAAEGVAVGTARLGPEGAAPSVKAASAHPPGRTATTNLRNRSFTERSP